MLQVLWGCLCVFVCLGPLFHTTAEENLKCRNRKLDLRGHRDAYPQGFKYSPAEEEELEREGGGLHSPNIPFFQPPAHTNSASHSSLSSLTSAESMTKEADFRQWLAVYMDNRRNVKRDTTKTVLKHSAVKRACGCNHAWAIKDGKEAQREVNKPQVPWCPLEPTDKHYYCSDVRIRLENFDRRQVHMRRLIHFKFFWLNFAILDSVSSPLIK